MVSITTGHQNNLILKFRICEFVFFLIYLIPSQVITSLVQTVIIDGFKKQNKTKTFNLVRSGTLFVFNLLTNTSGQNKHEYVSMR